MTRPRCVMVQVWIGLEAENADGPGTARDVELDVVDGKITEARMVVPRVRFECQTIPLPLLVAMVGPWQWEAFERDAAQLAARQAEDAEQRASDAEEDALDRADDANDLRRGAA